MPARRLRRAGEGPAIACTQKWRDPDGRLELGLGAGWDEHEHRAFGVPFPDVRTRMELLEESIAVTRLLWTGKEAHYAGRHYTLDGAHGHPRPDQRPGPPIIVAGTSGKASLRGAVQRVAGHRDNRRVAVGAFPAAQGGGRFVAVHLGHLTIHQHRVV